MKIKLPIIFRLPFLENFQDISFLSLVCTRKKKINLKTFSGIKQIISFPLPIIESPSEILAPTESTEDYHSQLP